MGSTWSTLHPAGLWGHGAQDPVPRRLHPLLAGGGDRADLSGLPGRQRGQHPQKRRHPLLGVHPAGGAGAHPGIGGPVRGAAHPGAGPGHRPGGGSGGGDERPPWQGSAPHRRRRRQPDHCADLQHGRHLLHRAHRRPLHAGRRLPDPAGVQYAAVPVLPGGGGGAAP